MDREEVRYEMRRSLTEWGIQPPAGGIEHTKFHNESIDTALHCFDQPKSKSFKFPKDNHDSFPSDMEDAIRHVLLSQFSSERENGYRLIQDDLKVHNWNGLEVSGVPPYEAIPIPGKKFNRRLRKEYSKLKHHQLDPLSRFTSQTVSKRDYYSTLWLECPATLQGVAFEAIVACHAIKNQPCYSCKYRGTLRWNGGSDENSSWRDLVCIKCHSQYEIKSKASVPKVHNCFRFNNTSGGSFYTFHHYKNHKSKLAKKYLVLVSRTFSILRSNAIFWPVEIAEIHYVVPRLSDRSFIFTGNRITIKSSIRTKLNTRQAWFKIPAFANARIDDLIQNALHGYFPAPDTKALIPSLNSKPEETMEEDHGMQIEALQMQLEDLRTTDDDDDWEAIYT